LSREQILIPLKGKHIMNSFLSARARARRQVSRQAGGFNIRPMAWVLAALFAVPGAALGDPVSIAEVPLMAGGAVDPNLMIMIDNSKQMRSNHAPFHAYKFGYRGPSGTNYSPEANHQNLAFRSSHVNKLYYNPQTTYTPPYRADGTRLPDQDFYGAEWDGFHIHDGPTAQLSYAPDDYTQKYPVVSRDKIDLSKHFREVKEDGVTWIVSVPKYNGQFRLDSGVQNDTRARSAFYALFDANLPGCKWQKNGKDVANFIPKDDLSNFTHEEALNYQYCFEVVEIGSAKDQAISGRTPAESRKNFANWFSYYRSKINLTRSVMSRVLNNLSPSIRVGFGVTGAAGAKPFSRIDTTKSDLVPDAEGKNRYDADSGHSEIYQGVRPFKDFTVDADYENNHDGGTPEKPNKPKTRGKFKSEIFGWLFGIDVDGAYETHNWAFSRMALGQAGNYYRNHNEPYRDKPGVGDILASGEENLARSCRRNYTLLVSSGRYDLSGYSCSSYERLNANGACNSESNEYNKFDYDSRMPPGGPISYTRPDGVTIKIEPKLPFSDGRYNGKLFTGPDGALRGYEFQTLADIAMYYWLNDLRDEDSNTNGCKTEQYGDSCTDNVPDTAVDPGNWQRMNTFVLDVGSVKGTVELGTLNDAKSVLKAAAYNDEAYLPSGWGHEYNETISDDGTGGTEWGNPADGRRSYMRDAVFANDLMHATINGHGGYYQSSNADELVAALNQTVNALRTDEATFTLTPTNSGSSKHPMLYQAIFNSSEWSSKLFGYKLCTGEEVGLDSGGQSSSTYKAERACAAEGDLWALPSWDASETLGSATAPSSRQIYTWDPKATSADGAGVEFSVNELGSDLKKLLLEDSATKQAELINYLRGDRSKEAQKGGPFRERPTNRLLGDIANSSPVFVGNDDFGFANAGGLDPLERNAYRKRKSLNSDRKEAIYVGANDGMLHAFDADPEGKGEEFFAYIPNNVIHKLKELGAPAYTHRFYVDGTPTVGDAYIKIKSTGLTQWNTVLVGSTGAGGNAYFALDIEHADKFSDNNVLWEISNEAPVDNGTPVFENLGVAIGQASITRLSDGTWVAIFGNGYNSKGNTARLFVVNLEDGSKIAEIDTKAGTADAPNGLATPVVSDADLDGVAEVAYAGDLEGNLWRFNLESLNSAPTLILQATYGSGASAVKQPITAKPEVTRHPQGGLMVYVGTGKFLGTPDPEDKSIQTFYGVQDLCALDSTCQSTTATRSTLLQQTAENATKYYSEGAAQVRVVTDNQMPTATNGKNAKQGFYLDLVAGNKKEDMKGERVTSAPLIWSDRVIFNTFEPSADVCLPPSDGWMYELDPFSGARTEFSVFDIDGDGVFGNQRDLVGDKVVSGKKVGMGVGLTARGSNKYLGNTKGGVEKIANNPRHLETGRKVWWQIR
jgi:type IV pilus assembly protein PilY1